VVVPKSNLNRHPSAEFATNRQQPSKNRSPAFSSWNISIVCHSIRQTFS